MPCKAQAKNAKNQPLLGWSLLGSLQRTLLPTASLRQLVTPLQYLA